ncbi:hypothetical protein ES703_23269 [subsurface metagenome]
MVKKRKKGKKKKYIKYEILTSDLLEVICQGYLLLDRSDIDIDLKDKKLVKEIWNMHKKEVMRIWRSDPKGNAGRRPKFWWLVEAIEPRLTISPKEYKKLYDRFEYDPSKIKGQKPKPDLTYFESDYAYLKRLNLLEDWELAEFKRIEKVFGKDSIYLRLWDFK